VKPSEALGFAGGTTRHEPVQRVSFCWMPSRNAACRARLRHHGTGGAVKNHRLDGESSFAAVINRPLRACAENRFDDFAVEKFGIMTPSLTV